MGNSVIQNDENSYLGKLLKSNDNQPYPSESIHLEIPSKKHHSESLWLNIYDTKVRDKMLEKLPATSDEFDIHCHSIDSLRNSHTISHSEVLEIEKNTRQQSSSDRWYVERGKRLTSSNFGAVVK